MKKTFILSLLILSFFAFGQKMKLKDGSVLLDKIKVYNYTEDGVITISTLSNKELFVLKYNDYEKPNPSYGTIGCPASNCQKMLRYSFITFRFLNNGEEFFTDVSTKDIIKYFYNAGILKEDGTYDEEKRATFINKYSDDNLKYKLLK